MKEQASETNVVRAGIWYTISTIMVKAISVISTPILTRMMTKADYGIATTFSSWNSLLLIICSLNLGYSVGRAKQDFPNQFDRYIGSMQILGSVVTGIMVVLSLLFINPVSNLLELDKTCIVILFLYLWGGMIVNMQQNWYRFNYKYKQNIGITVYTAISTIMLSIVLVAFRDENKYVGRCLGLALPAFVLGIAFVIGGIKERRLCCNKSYWKYGLRLSIPLIMHTISLYVLGQSDRIFITKICGQEATGMYSLAYQYAALISLITNALNEAWNPWFHDTYYEKKYEEIRKKFVIHEEQIIPFPLKEGQLLHAGDYLASDGVHHKKQTIIFDGDENVAIYNVTDENFNNYSIGIHSYYKKMLSYQADDKCSHFINLGHSPSWGREANKFALSTNYFLYLMFPKNVMTSVDEVKNWIIEQYNNGIPLTAEGTLEEEHIEPYTEEQQAVYNELQRLILYKGYNYITCIDETKCKMKLTYRPDNNVKIKSLEERIAALESEATV